MGLFDSGEDFFGYGTGKNGKKLYGGGDYGNSSHDNVMPSMDEMFYDPMGYHNNHSSHHEHTERKSSKEEKDDDGYDDFGNHDIMKLAGMAIGGAVAIGATNITLNALRALDPNNH